MESVTSSRWQILRDCGLLISVVLLSVAFYTSRLGFYNDDWAVLATLDLADNHSVGALAGQLLRNHREIVVRPLEVFFWVTSYKLFGLQPLGYHIVNALMLVCNVLLFYFCLRELQKSRLLALAVPLLFITLPHYSTDRFWTSATIASVSMAFYFASLYCDLRAVRVYGWRFTAWKAGSVGALLVSTFAYETALPLFLINPLLVRYRAGIYRTKPLERRKTRTALLFLYGSNPMLIGAVFLFKTVLDQRGGVPKGNLIHYFLSLGYTVIKPIRKEEDFGFNIWQFIGVDLVDRGLKLPFLALESLLRRYVEWAQVVGALALGVLVFFYLYLAGSLELDLLRDRINWIRIVVAGLVASLAGYAIFLIVPNVQFTLAGDNNRVSMSAAAGIAVFLVGVIGWGVSRIRARSLQSIAFASLVTLFAASGCIVNDAIASFWVAAWSRQKIILAAIRNHFETIQVGRAFLLDGICGFVGPAAVFEFKYDFQGALQLLYRDRSLRADVVTPRLKLLPDGLETENWGVVNKYRYGDDLMVYNASNNSNKYLKDEETAKKYFSKNAPNSPTDCSRASLGVGLPIF